MIERRGAGVVATGRREFVVGGAAIGEAVELREFVEGCEPIGGRELFKGSEPIGDRELFTGCEIIGIAVWGGTFA